ncbi:MULTISPECIES: ABC transporter substrate-binding protein [unclassified Chelatococcus]|uniref:ABC transporter substrate-binding protein n=1 Tax=unclassified Chelatococcus TaxID=2638111 RepID=UPI001BCF9FC1|nr:MULTISPECIES: ABC transporter substrate-binding protein [unclassified Chelatococcus]CAH1656105.1 ABC transporter substrate-binding protein [Hyphomicrobiales bacterium]MBS7742506.1 ABC transporter substrate-binding protein [Chelatococcus sp. HY11]MBX3542376.1 ABC transporter substrate-binding protein [Chelatococcus sp.]MCO5075407.1 ABC transporter substrate-binding protein [Chelatococcus sp.]CAH1695739.1 ABC transporter substrate-binding protein [Hyphomicrobiales bacterium]
MNHPVRFSRLLVAATALSLTLLTSVSAQDLTVAVGVEPTTLDPLISEDGGERAVGRNIFDTVLARTAAGEIVPNVAEALPKQLDPTTWEIRIRPGITFHNGEPLDAAAVAFSVNHLVDPAFKSRQLLYFATLASAEAVDDRTVRITTKAPDPALPARLAFLSVVPPKAAVGADFASNPVGSGPFRFVGWDRGNQIRLERNDGYWGAKPDFAKATFRFVQEPGVRVAGLQAGEFDIVTQLPPESAKDVPKTESEFGELMTVSLNAKLGLTQDRRVRQALNYAIDKKALAEDLFLGEARPMTSQLLGTNWFGFNDQLGEWPYDPEKARKLLEEAGAIGKPIDLVGTAGRWLKGREIVDAMAAYWEAVGLKPQVKILAWTDYLATLRNRAADPSARFVGHSNLLFDADRTTTSYYEPGGSSNAFDSDELKKLVNAARYETDPAKRLDLYRQITKIGSDEALFIFLIQTADIYGLSKRVDYKPRADGLLILRDAKLVRN